VTTAAARRTLGPIPEAEEVPVVVVAALLALLGCVAVGATVPGMFWLVLVSGLLFEVGAALWFVHSTVRPEPRPDNVIPFPLRQDAGAGATSKIA
jgi:hypothetical protein